MKMVSGRIVLTAVIFSMAAFGCETTDSGTDDGLDAQVEDIADKPDESMGDTFVPETSVEDSAEDLAEPDNGIDTGLDTARPDVTPIQCTIDQECLDALGVPEEVSCDRVFCDQPTGICLKGSKDDGSSCTPDNACEINGLCENGDCIGVEIDCDDGNPCTVDTCDPSAEVACVHENATGSCDDKNACTSDDTCQEGVCVGGVNSCSCGEDLDCVNHDDGNLCNGVLKCVDDVCVFDGDSVVACEPSEDPCKQNVCDPATGNCLFESANEGSSCNDLNKCTLSDTCVAGICKGQVSKACDDYNPCTDDACDPTQGCVFEPNDNSCDDGNSCTEGDTCTFGFCMGVRTPECGCIRHADCAVFEDGDMCNGTLICKAGACIVDTLTVVTCPDLMTNSCQRNTCVPETGACQVDNVPNGRECNDNNACTLYSDCQEGACLAEGEVLSCMDENVCTDDSCDPMKGCVFTSNTADCDLYPGMPCVVDGHCSKGTCVQNPPNNCDDSNPCTNDFCDDDGVCQHDPNFAECDDLNRCTVNDTCNADGVCGGTWLEDCCLKERDCDQFEDGDLCNGKLSCMDGECTIDRNTIVTCPSPFPETPCSGYLCTPATGKCNPAPLPDGSTCTRDPEDACLAHGECNDGVCEQAEPVDCDDNNDCTIDYCIPVSADCGHTPVNDQSCNDGSVCTLGDTCDNGVCTGQEFVDCDDSIECTMDICDLLVGCVNTPIDVICDDGNICTNDSCNGDIGCQHIANHVNCDDENPCTVNDVCTNKTCDGSPKDCEDAIGCTDDTCEVATGDCVHTPVDSTCEDYNVCTTNHCDTTTGCVANNNTLPCNDSNGCTLDDVCGGGVCAGASVDCDDGYSCTLDYCDGSTVGNSYECVNEPQDSQCRDENSCTDDYCNPLYGVTGTGCWNPANENPCNDENPCTLGDRCVDSVCMAGAEKTCDSSTNTYCLNNKCNPTNGACTMTPVNENKLCNDSNLCTTGERCLTGLCTGTAKDCGDQVDCTDDSCNSRTGLCENAPNDQLCDDGNECTADSCKAEAGCEHTYVEGCVVCMDIWTCKINCDGVRVCMDSCDVDFATEVPAYELLETCMLNECDSSPAPEPDATCMIGNCWAAWRACGGCQTFPTCDDGIENTDDECVQESGDCTFT